MAVQQLQIPSSNINNTVDQSQWATLGNLGNVYQKAQEQQRQQAALSALGPDATANAQTLLRSGVPSLAQLGLNMQQKALEQAREDARYKVTDARANAQLAIQEAAAKRAQETYDQEEEDRQTAGKLLAGFLPGAPAAGAPTTTSPAAPFPAPLPGAMPAAPQAAAALPQAPAIQPAPPAQPSAFGATPPLPATLTPPVKAEGGDPSALPGWVQSAQAQPPDTSIIGRVSDNLTSPHPTAAAGISRDQLAALYSNPVTRPLATAFLQKQLDPGTWSYTKLDDGRLVATNNRTNEVKDVTPPTATGAPPALKDQRERDARYADAKARGYDDATANYVAINGKLPKEDLSPTEMKAVDNARSVVENGQSVLENIQSLKTLSPKAYTGAYALARSKALTGLLPESMTPQGAIDTQDLQNMAHSNVALQAKTVFGSRITNLDLQLLKELESTAEQPDAVRQRLYQRVEKMVQGKVSAAQAEMEGIRNKTYFKPGGGAPAAGGGAPAGAADPLGLR